MIAAVHSLLNSNIVQIMLTILAGGLSYGFLAFGGRSQALTGGGLPRGEFLAMRALRLGVVLVVVALLFSMIFDVGEVYHYSFWYKRTFFYFGDDFPVLMIFPLLVFYKISDWRFVNLVFFALLLFGGRFTLLLALFAVAAVDRFHLLSWNWRRIAKIGMMQVVLLFAVIMLSHAVEGTFVRQARGALSGLPFHSAELPHKIGSGSCRDLGKCYETQVVGAVRQRLFSTIAGVWMTLEGGFHGEAYPNTDQKFADLMTQVDPYGLNERFNISRKEWALIGMVQNPYLNFGAGYGLVATIFLFTVVCGVGLLGLWNIKTGLDRGVWSSLSVFYALVVFLDQFQPWIQSRSPLFWLLCFCGAHIITVRIKAILWQQRPVIQTNRG